MFTPIKDEVLIQRHQDPPGRVLLPRASTAKAIPCHGKVLAVGPYCKETTDIHVGRRVIFDDFKTKKVTTPEEHLRGEIGSFVLIPEGNILAVIEPDEDQQDPIVPVEA